MLGVDPVHGDSDAEQVQGLRGGRGLEEDTRDGDDAAVGEGDKGVSGSGATKANDSKEAAMADSGILFEIDSGPLAKFRVNPTNLARTSMIRLDGVKHLADLSSCIEESSDC